MTSKTTTDSKEDSRVSRAIHGGADRIIALIETEKEKEVLSHKAQLKDLESRHNQLKNNAAMVYASASLRIEKLEAELKDMEKEQSKAMMEARAETDRVTAELTQVKGCLDKLNTALKENRMTYLDDTILSDDEAVVHGNELICEAGNSGSVGPDLNDTSDSGKEQASESPLLIVSAFTQYLKFHRCAVQKWKDRYQAMRDERDMEKRRADGATMNTRTTTADLIDTKLIVSCSSSTDARKRSDPGLVALQAPPFADFLTSPQGNLTMALNLERPL